VSGTGVKEDASLAEARFYPARDQSFFIKYLRHNAWDYGFAMLVPDPSFVASFPFSKLSKISTGYNGHFAKPAFSSFLANFYYQTQDRDFANQFAIPGFSFLSDTVTRTHSFGFDAQATALLPGRQVLTYGVSFYRDYNRDQRVQILFPGTPYEQVASRAPSVPNSAMSGTGIFLQDQVSVSSRFSLTGGLRFDVFKLSVFPTENYSSTALTGILGGRLDSAVSGQVGAIYEVLPGLQLVGNVGRAFREPNLFERFFYGSAPVDAFFVPNPGLRPETSLNFEGGARLRASRFSASVTYFQNRLRDLITYAPGTFNGQTTLNGLPVYQNVNVNRSRIQGVEAEARWQRSALGSYWTPFMTMSFQNGTDLGTGDALPLIAPAVGHVGLRWETSRRRLWAEVRARVTRGSTRVPPELDPLQGFSMFSLRGGCELVRGDRTRLFSRGLKSVALRFGIENLGDRVYRELFNSVPEAGRHARVGLDFTF
jgi:hemoglobin/transferrin/lactoferrin receptor protein